MPPFNLPLSTFGAFLAVAGAILLAILWALLDRARDRS